MSATLTLALDASLRTRLDEVAAGRNTTAERVVEAVVTDFLVREPRLPVGRKAPPPAIRTSTGEPGGTRQGIDPYLAHLNATFDEWNTPEDAEAFDDL